VVLARKAEAAVGLALEAGEVEEQRRKLRRRLAFLGDDAGLAEALRADGVGAGRSQSARLELRVGVLAFGTLELLVEPAAGVGAGRWPGRWR
jgi:hypothetical protein